MEGGGKQSFVSMISERQTKYGRSSYRLVREQRMMAKSKEENGKRYQITCLLVNLSTKQSTCLLVYTSTCQLIFLLFFLIAWC